MVYKALYHPLLHASLPSCPPSLITLQLQWPYWNGHTKLIPVSGSLHLLFPLHGTSTHRCWHGVSISNIISSDSLTLTSLGKVFLCSQCPTKKHSIFSEALRYRTILFSCLLVYYMPSSPTHTHILNYNLHENRYHICPTVISLAPTTEGGT